MRVSESIDPFLGGPCRVGFGLGASCCVVGVGVVMELLPPGRIKPPIWIDGTCAGWFAAVEVGMFCCCWREGVGIGALVVMLPPGRIRPPI